MVPRGGIEPPTREFSVPFFAKEISITVPESENFQLRDLNGLG